jgi:hypothetical protein
MSPRIKDLAMSMITIIVIPFPQKLALRYNLKQSGTCTQCCACH